MYESLFAAKKIAVLGDTILDHYIIGRTERVSPEAPVLVLQHESEYYRLGGSANVALNIAALGGQPYLISVLGADTAGNELKNLLEQQNISTNYLLEDSQRPTTLKTRFLARHQQLLRHDRESLADISEDLTQALLHKFELAIADGVQTLIFQDYNKGVLHKKLINAAMQLAQKRGLQTIIDPKKKNFDAYQGCTLFKPNLREVSEAVNINLDSSPLNFEAIAQAAQQLRAAYMAKYFCITLGAAGILLAYPDGSCRHFATKTRIIADVCGAGDTVVATLAMAMANHLDIDKAVQLANLAGGQVCEKIGVVAVDKNLLWQEWAQD
jgi:rfaE bifunctional protein kinase chain/domain